MPLILGMGWFPDQAGGLNRYVRDLVEALPEARAVVLGPATDAPLRVRTAGRTGDVLPLLLSRFGRVARAEAIGVDVIDAHFALTAMSAIGGSSRHTPLVVHFHGPWADESAAVGGGSVSVAIKRAIERRVYRRATRVITLSQAFKDLVVERYGVAERDVEVVPPGVDLTSFSSSGRDAARRRLQLPEDAFIVVAARRLVPRMGLDVLIDAWRSVMETRPGSLLLIAGDGPERARLDELRPDSVRLLGRVTDSELIDLYSAADVSVVPSIALEGFGLVALESLACGTPVVVSDTGGLPDVVRGLDPSLIVPAGDAVALARRLIEPLPSQADCRTYAERFSWREVAERHREIYRGVARPRVVFIDHTAKLSGGELALLRLLPELDIDAHVILGEAGPLVGRLEELGIPVEVLSLGRATRELGRERVPGAWRRIPSTLGYSVRLARRLRALDADVVHTNSLKAALYGGLAGRLARIPTVWHIRDRISQDYLPPSAVSLVRAAARILPSAIVANSRETLSTLPERRRMFVVPSPVEIGEPPSRNGLTVNGSLRIGMVGRIAPWKGQHVFLQGFAHAFPDGNEVARVIGAPLFGADEDAYEHELHALAKRLDLGGRVEFRGFREDVGAELSQLDVLVHASVLPEPFGQVVVEGMAAGLPVVATANGGPAEIIENERTGLLYAPGDIDGLATCLRRLAADPGLRARLGSAAVAEAEKYSARQIAPLVHDVYRSIR